MVNHHDVLYAGEQLGHMVTGLCVRYRGLDLVVQLVDLGNLGTRWEAARWIDPDDPLTEDLSVGCGATPTAALDAYIADNDIELEDE